jgi:hypothetical protein
MMQLEDAANCLERAQKYVVPLMTSDLAEGRKTAKEPSLRTFPTGELIRPQFHFMALPCSYYVHAHYARSSTNHGHLNTTLVNSQEQLLLRRSCILRAVSNIQSLPAVQIARVAADLVVLGHTYK